MDQPPEKDLESFIHEELRRLPGLAAPPSLIGNVQAALARQAALPWWRRSWFDWPRPARLGSAFVLTALGILLCLIPWWEWQMPAPVSSELGLGLNQVSSAWETTRSILSALGLVLRSFASSPWVWLAAVLSALTYLFVVGVGAFFIRFAWTRSVERGAA